jgi:hypothetical protein
VKTFNLQPMMMGDSFSFREQATTINQLQRPIIRYLEIQPYNAAALPDCRSVLEDVMQCWRRLCKGASVLTISMGPEYPGLDESVLLEGNGVPLED